MKFHLDCCSLGGALAMLALLAMPLQAQTTATQTASSAATSAGGLSTAVPPTRGFISTVGAPIGKVHSCWKRSTLRKLLKNGMAPLNAATGGLIGGGHDQPPPPPLAPPPPPPPPPPGVSAAAKIKMDAALAEERVAAVRYLATVDCHWYPEAEDGLIASLRADGSECVRLAAAQALGRGCCCTKKTIAALQVSAAGSNIDGNPGERCDRVRWAALHALQNCLLQCDATQLKQPAYHQRPESPEDPLAASAAARPMRSTFYDRIQAVEPERVLHEAQQTVARLTPRQAPAAVVQDPAAGGLYGIWAATRAAPQVAPAAAVEEVYSVTSPLPPVEPVTTMPAGYPLARPLQPRPTYDTGGQVLPASAPAPVEGYSYETIGR